MHVHDLIGIGFGPSNIALAIALEERHGRGSPTGPLFIEKQPCFAWHPDMMLDGAHMQISFLKDLVTLRNPASRYSFLNYLHSKGRLQDFINLKTFFPSRQEFNDYLAWAAGHFDDCCAYGEQVLEVQPEPAGGVVELLRVRSRGADGGLRERLARNLVVSVGGRPRIPDVFASCMDDSRVFHTSGYLSALSRQPRLDRIAVIGAGQSAAEIFMHLHGHPARPRVDLLVRGHTIRPSDDSPFVNEVFNAAHTDYLYARPDAERAALLAQTRHTNYSAPDVDLIERIYDVLYQQKVRGEPRHRLLRRREVEAVRTAEAGVALSVRERDAGTLDTLHYDAVVLATGYERDQHRSLLAPLDDYLDSYEPDRHYRLRADERLRPAIYVQGGSEATHGISDSLLSILAIRSWEIGAALKRPETAPGPQAARAALAS
ncbi:lysine N(6)-hydroxylase/L-ornithine N(5)-oxygenase family protein [Bordetella bronchialis]|uniref:Ornithine monooxygenase n=1 Tax=Bordetella bronchialis TaxID=463025 RepID=A0A193FVI9_9BORD|nr:lysine N(6)-hydroxylase/L-ornithine N(5)-oxygenase family protein [Bordetella bronchialis]ANN71772.1 ornithine monooxygenase [Bordetella bronchialis]